MSYTDLGQEQHGNFSKFAQQLLLVLVITMPLYYVTKAVLWLFSSKVSLVESYNWLLGVSLLAFALGTLQARWWGFTTALKNGFTFGGMFLGSLMHLFGWEFVPAYLVFVVAWTIYLFVGAMLGEETKVAVDSVIRNNHHQHLQTIQRFSPTSSA